MTHTIQERLRDFQRIVNSANAFPLDRSGLHSQAADRIDALEAALRGMVYETTSLSQLEDDGSHWCKISGECLATARAALTGETACYPAKQAR